MTHNILKERLIRTTDAAGGVTSRSLPGVYEALAADAVIGFPALRAHQRHGWHAFLAQLGAIAVHESGADEPPTDAGTWERMLRQLTRAYPRDEPWHLVVDALDCPAFLQTPPCDLLHEYTRTSLTPDGLDVLVSSKNHDIKQDIATTAEAEDWLFALVNVQTTGGFTGRGRYGSVRMNKGFSTRSAIGLRPDGVNTGGHLYHDIRQLLIHRETNRLRNRPARRKSGGLALLWLEPLDGHSQHEVTALDPYFLEAPRRIRLRAGGPTGITGLRATRASVSIAASSLKGNIGDHWTPIIKPDGKAYSLGAGGWKWRSLMRLIAAKTEVELPTAMTPKGCDHVKRWRLVARGMARTQGGTEGYHERTDITFGSAFVEMLGTTRGRERIERAANAVEKAASKARSRLRLALAICAASGKGGNALQSQHWTAATRACAPFENAIEREFFPILEATALAAEDASSATAADALDTAIGEIAEKVLETGLQHLAPSGWRRDQATTNARRAYRGKTEPTRPANGNGNDAGDDSSEQRARTARSGAPSPETPAADKATKPAPDPVADAARELLHSIQLLSKAEQHRLDRIPLDGGSGSAGHAVEDDPIVTRLRDAHAKADAGRRRPDLDRAHPGGPRGHPAEEAGHRPDAGGEAARRRPAACAGERRDAPPAGAQRGQAPCDRDGTRMPADEGHEDAAGGHRRHLPLHRRPRRRERRPHRRELLQPAPPPLRAGPAAATRNDGPES